MLTKRLKIMTMIMLLSVFLINRLFCQDDELVNRDLLIQDFRQLVQIFETSHPDPYFNMKSKIEFHRVFQNTALSIPEQGMTKKEFYRILLPFVATVGDGNTSLQDTYSLDYNSPGGIPLYFDVVEKILYIQGVPEESGCLNKPCKKIINTVYST